MIRIASVAAVPSESENPVILSVVNIEENPQLKNQSTRLSRTQFPERQLIISVLFSTAHTDYLVGIDKLQTVIVYLQRHAVFEIFDETPVLPIVTNPTQISAEEIQKNILRFTVELLPQTIEQQAQLWLGLGICYRPSVLYKLTFGL